MGLKFISTSLTILALTVLVGCQSDLDENPLSNVDLISSFDFENGHQDWVAGVSDYAVDNLSPEADYAYSFYNSKTPLYLPWQGYGLTITAENPHGDLFYFFKKKIVGLHAGATYKVDFEFIVYTQLDSGKVVAPAEDIFLKVGVIQTEPMALFSQAGGMTDYYTLNADKGNTNADSGEDLKNMGSIKKYTKSTVEAISGNTFASPLIAKTDAQGSVWLIIGVDSAIKNKLTFGLMAMTAYYTEIK